MTKTLRRRPSALIQPLPPASDGRAAEECGPAGKPDRGIATETAAEVGPPADDDTRAAAARLMHAFVNDVLTDWRAHGGTAIASVRSERAHDYLKLVTSLFPRESDAKVSGLDELSDEQLGEQLAAVLAQLAAASAVPGA